jgi:hypothetical protein
MKSARKVLMNKSSDAATGARVRTGNRGITQIKRFAALLLFAASTAHSYVGSFDPERHEYTGPQLVTFVDSNAAPIRCIEMATEMGDYAGAVLGVLAPMAACTDATKIDCTIIAPISPGAGQLIAVVGALAGPDALLGHEFRHCRDHDFHPAALPFVKL